MENITQPHTDRKHYAPPIGEEWNSRNTINNTFHIPETTTNQRIQNYFDEEDMVGTNQTIAATRQTAYFPPGQFYGFGGQGQPNRRMMDFKAKSKPSSRNARSRRNLKQSIKDAYHNIHPILSQTSKFKMKQKRPKKGTIWSNERPVDLDRNVRVSHNGKLGGPMPFLTSPANSSKGSQPRVHKKSNESLVALKQQIKDLRELLKERDSVILSQKMQLNMSKINDSFNEKEELMQEVSRLKDYISMILDQHGDPNQNVKTAYEKMMEDFDNAKKEIARLKAENKSLRGPGSKKASNAGPPSEGKGINFLIQTDAKQKKMPSITKRNTLDNKMPSVAAAKSGFVDYKEKYETILSNSNSKQKQLNGVIKTKNKELEEKKSVIQQKDQLIEYLEKQVEGLKKEENKLKEPKQGKGRIISKAKSEEVSKAMKDQMALRSETVEVEEEKDNHMFAQEFFLRLSNFLFKKRLTLYKIIHHKIFDKMLNGVEVELITVDHFWRLLHKIGYKTVKVERKAVTELVQNKFLNNIIEVRNISKILSQLGIEEDMPISTKNFDYEQLSG